jgi:DGQHR domain-containing protein
MILKGKYQMNANSIEVQGFLLQDPPRIYISAISGTWLLKHTTPSWRIKDPDLGFQRVVNEERARKIALAVLDQRRTFPNAIVLATDRSHFDMDGAYFQIPSNIKFLVVDGQHRLWAQKFSKFDAKYSCLIHMGLSEVEMARLFLEINDNQKRVPSSLRWDLVRLVRPEDDLEAIAAADMVLLLATEERSPLFQRIDLTGEQSEIQLKQGSLAPELKPFFTKHSPLYNLSFDQQYKVISQYLVAIREIDRDRWGKPESPFYRARVLRALLRLLPELIRTITKETTTLTYRDFLPFLKKIDEAMLNPDVIRAAQGSAGMKALYDQLRAQILG